MSTRTGVSRSLQSGRNFTSPFTNLTWFADVEPAAFLSGLQRGGGLPLDTLPGFLHEATHHWCFNFTAGTAMALLYRRALRDAVPREGSSGLSEDTAMCLTGSMMRVEAFLAIQQPLAEGMALFAEFDLFATEEYRLRCLPLERAADLFSQSVALSDQPDAPSNPKTPGLLNGMLGMMHLAPVALRRKTDVLLLPLDAAEGYLPGYLLVKQFWFLGMAADPRLADPELFLTYLTWFFYADLGLVARLLDDTADIPTMMRVIEYFVGRLKAFLTAEHSHNVDQLVSYRVPGRAYDGIQAWTEAQPLFDVDPELAETGRSRFLSVYDDILHWSAASTGEITQEDLENNIFMFRRRLLALARFLVRIEADDQGNFTAYAGTAPLFTGTTAADGMRGKTAEGSAEAFIDHALGFVGIAIVADESVIGSWFSADTPEDWKHEFLAFRTDLSEAYEQGEALLAWLKDATRSAAPWLFPLEVARDQAEQAASGTYAPLAALLLRRQGLFWKTAPKDGDPADIITRLERNGLLTVLERVRYVRAAAWGSLAAPQTAAYPEAAQQIFPHYCDFHRVDEGLWEAMLYVQKKGVEHLGHPLLFHANGQDRFAI